MDEVPVALTLPGEVDETDAVLVPEAVPVPVTVDAVTEGLADAVGDGEADAVGPCVADLLSVAVAVLAVAVTEPV